MKNALIIFGGVSSEHNVSLLSATSVIKNTPKDKYNVVMLGVTKEGEMYLYTGDVENLANDVWLNNKANLKKATISTNHSDHGILVLDNGKYELIKLMFATLCFTVKTVRTEQCKDFLQSQVFLMLVAIQWHQQFVWIKQ